MTELTRNEIDAVLPALVRAAELVAMRPSVSDEDKPSRLAHEYKKAVAALKGPDKPFIANISHLSPSEQVEAAQGFLVELIKEREAGSGGFKVSPSAPKDAAKDRASSYGLDPRIIRNAEGFSNPNGV